MRQSAAFCWKMLQSAAWSIWEVSLMEYNVRVSSCTCCASWEGKKDRYDRDNSSPSLESETIDWTISMLHLVSYSYLVWLSFRLKEVRNGILVFPTLLFFCTSLLKVQLCNKYNSSASTFRSSDLVTMALSKLFSKIAWAISLSEILPPNWIKREGKISLAVAICASVTPNTMATHP